MSDRIYYEDQGSWGADDFYALFRYLNRMLLNSGGRRTAEISAIDLDRLTPETKHLLKHMLFAKQAFDRIVTEFPNLEGLQNQPELDHPLYLSWAPTLAYPYFTDHGIFL